MWDPVVQWTSPLRCSYDVFVARRRWPLLRLSKPVPPRARPVFIFPVRNGREDSLGLLSPPSPLCFLIRNFNPHSLASQILVQNIQQKTRKKKTTRVRKSRYQFYLAAVYGRHGQITSWSGHVYLSPNWMGKQIWGGYLEGRERALVRPKQRLLDQVKKH